MADLNLQTKMNKYSWKIASMAKGIDPDAALLELERIENLFGSLTAETVLNASKEKDALLHPLFQWDDTKAAHQFRLQQAKTIINNVQVNVIREGVEIQIPVYEIVRVDEGRQYKSIETMDRSDIEYVKQSTKREINYLKNKLILYNDFNETIKHLDSALNTL
jgi:hypothetical protein